MTIRQIAELAGVSPAAVSFVLNGRPGVSPEKRQKIQWMLREYGYTIKSEAEKSIAKKQIRFIKCRSKYQQDEFAINILDAVEGAAVALGCSVGVINIDPASYELTLSALDYSEISGIIFLASELTPECLRYTFQLPVPTVYIDIDANSEPINTVNAAQRSGSFLAARHLASLGHRHIGYLRSRPQYGCLGQRFECFQNAARQLELELAPAHIFDVDILAEGMEERLLRRISRTYKLPTAFFADSDALASIGIYALQQNGLGVPEDVSVIGFDNTKLSSLITPRLTTIEINVNEMGRSAVERLCQLMEDRTRPASYTDVSVSLVKRDSTAFCKGK